MAPRRESRAGRECLARGADPAYPGFDPDDLARCLGLDAFGRDLRAVPEAFGLYRIALC